MREIKFRGFRVNENGNTVITVNGKDYKGEWVYGSLLDLVTGIYISPIDTSYNEIDVGLGQKITINAMWEDNDFFEVIPETISQYTGLHDKNGKEIYEGDIVRHIWQGGHGKISEIIGEVKWRNGAFVVDNKKRYDWLLSLHVLSQSATAEIIGNIFGNPKEIESEE